MEEKRENLHDEIHAYYLSFSSFFLEKETQEIKCRKPQKRRSELSKALLSLLNDG